MLFRVKTLFLEKNIGHSEKKALRITIQYKNVFHRNNAIRCILQVETVY